MPHICRIAYRFFYLYIWNPANCYILSFLSESEPTSGYKSLCITLCSHSFEPCQEYLTFYSFLCIVRNPHLSSWVQSLAKGCYEMISLWPQNKWCCIFNPCNPSHHSSCFKIRYTFKLACQNHAEAISNNNPAEVRVKRNQNQYIFRRNAAPFRLLHERKTVFGLI